MWQPWKHSPSCVLLASSWCAAVAGLQVWVPQKEQHLETVACGLRLLLNSLHALLQSSKIQRACAALIPCI